MKHIATRITRAVVVAGVLTTGSLGVLQVDSASAQGGDDSRHSVVQAAESPLFAPSAGTTDAPAAGDLAQADDGSSTQKKGPVTAFGKCQVPGKCTVGLKFTIWRF